MIAHEPACVQENDKASENKYLSERGFVVRHAISHGRTQQVSQSCQDSFNGKISIEIRSQVNVAECMENHDSCIMAQDASLVGVSRSSSPIKPIRCYQTDFL